MKKIIVPIDFSEHSEYALETAAILARQQNAEIIALHMLELPLNLLSTSASQEQFENIYFVNLSKTTMDSFLKRDYLEGVKVSTQILNFKDFTEISTIAESNDADLIIMGSHGTSGAKEMFVGSNTEKVVRYSDVPVLVVKHSPILTAIETVVFACDFSDKSIPAYLKAKRLFDTLGVKMYLVYINMPEFFQSSVEMQSRVSRFLKKAEGHLDNLNNVGYVCDYNTETGILNYSNLMGVDLIAMATHGRTGLTHFFNGSLTEDIANHSALPVMTFKL